MKLNPIWIQQQLQLAGSALRLQFLAEASSSNSLLLAQAKNLNAHGSVLLVENQTAGRGRVGRSWLSSPEHSLTFSLLWQFSCMPQQLAGLSLVVGWAIAQSLTELGVPILLKWPNDLVTQQGKLGGILLEMASGHGACGVVIGVGLNCTQDIELQQRGLSEGVHLSAASLQEVTDFSMNRNQILCSILLRLEQSLLQFASQGFAPFVALWQGYHRDQHAVIRLVLPSGQIIVGEALGVDEQGQLCLSTDQGAQKFHSGELLP